jgi:hydrophobe/amphiphile efflux-1 (HAE1) family protein/NodT family efflux transporter outer membrane factor (OMF) lipoprotein
MKGNIFISRNVMAISIAIVIMLIGFICLNTLPVEQYPNIAPPTVEVTTSYSGADANTCMKSVIQPLEEQINGVQDMTYMTATASSTGDVTIVVYFKQGADPDMATVNVQNRVSQAEALLPSDVLQTGITVTKRQNSILQIAGLKSTDGKYDADFISNYIDINVKPRLLRITGVGNVSNLGNTYALRVWMKPDVMAQYGLEPDDISSAIQSQSFVTSTGTLGQQSENAYQYPMEYKGTLKSIEEFENIVLRTQGNSNILYLKDVATVEIGAKSYTMTSVIDGKPGVFYLVNQSPGANATLVNEQIDELYKQLEPTLPAGLEFVTLETSNDFLFAAIHNVVETLIIAILLVILVVYFFLQNWKATLIPSISIIVSLLGTFAIVRLAGFSLNILTLFALVLAIGTVVDDAIVVVEAVMAKLETGKMPGDTPKAKAIEATRQAMSEVSVAVISCTLVFMAVFIPVTFMSGTSGTFFTQFGITIAGSVGLSCVCALVLCPALCAILMRPNEASNVEGKKWKGIDYYTKLAYEASYTAILGKYQGAVKRYLKRPWMSFALLACAAVLFVLFMKVLPSGLVPQEDQGVIMCEVRMPEGSTLHENTEIMKQVEEKVKAIPELESYALCSGYGLISSNGSSYASLIIRLKNWDDRPGFNHYIDMIIYRFYLDCQSIKNAQVLPFQMPQIPGYGTSNSIDLQVQDKSDGDMSDFGNKTNEFLTKLQERPEIGSAMSTFSERFPKFKVHVDPIQCERAGTTAKAVLNTLGAYCGGSYVGNFNQFSKVYNILVGAAPEYRLDPSSLNNMYIKVSDNKMAPLSQFIKLEEIVGSSSHNHFNLYQSISCSVTAGNGYSEAQAHQAIAEVFKETMPNYCTYEYGSMSREVEESSKSNTTLLIYLICVVLIYLILGSLYNSWLTPFAVLLSVPFGLMGSFLFSWVGNKLGLPGMENNIYLQTGVIMLIGLLAKTAILITEFASERRKQGLSIVDAALEAAHDRLRPILMTVITMIVGMIPLIIAGGAGANGNRALALGVVGGMTIGTLALVFVVPAFFIVFQNLEEKVNGVPVIAEEPKEEIAKPKKPRRPRAKKAVTAILLLVTCAIMSSCGVYKKYTPQTGAPDNLFGNLDSLQQVMEDSTIATISWREFFTDPLLQELIDSALVRNTDVKSARISVEKAQASLRAAKLAWLPSLSINPSGGVSSYVTTAGSVSAASWTYSAPLQLDWNLGGSNSVIVNKRKAKTVLAQAEAQQKAMQANIISTVAQEYFTLLLLDKQLQILVETDSLWNESLETQRALWENGKAYSTAVDQMESSNLSVKMQIIDIKRSIVATENELCRLLVQTPQPIQRHAWGDYQLPERFGTGVPAVLLENRPDIKAADQAIAEAFYGVASAKAAFYPSFNLSGLLGWSNNGGAIADPGAFLMQAGLSLIQPVFELGKLRANLKIAKLEQEEMLHQYVQTVINAGNQVNEALADCQTAKQKDILYKQQVAVLHSAYIGTHALMDNGKASYIEVLTAQESLLSAQLDEASNLYDGAIGLISLYVSLGGATK